MRHLSTHLPIYFPQHLLNDDNVPESRRRAVEPIDDGTFILPMKQCFMKNKRIMNSTARLIALLSGWAGKGGPIETTQGILAKHIGRSVRQVQRMLQDAIREGYMTVAYTKSRIGMITGIRIYLRLGRIRMQKRAVAPCKPGTPLTSDTNGKQLHYKKDKELEDTLRRMATALGCEHQLE